MKIYTLWLSLVCLLVFILQKLASGFTSLFILNQDSFFQPWRFLTAIFLHASFVHLLYNLFALMLFGMILENEIKSSKFLILFMGSGILANIVAVNFYSSSLGASGAIFSIIGCLTILRPKLTVWAFSLPMPLFLASILWVAGDLLGVFMPYNNTANLAHLAGIAVGLIAGVFLRIRKLETQTRFEIKYEIPESYIKEWEKFYLRR